MRYYEKDIEGPKFAMKSERAKEVMPELRQSMNKN